MIAENKRNIRNKNPINHSMIIRFFLFFILSTLFLSLSSIKLYAQDASFGVTNSVVIDGKNIKDGDIISYSPKGYILSNTEYDPMMAGVVTRNSAISIDIDTGDKTYPVMVTGNALVNVSTKNGAIKRGDPITSSSTPGVGMKATTSGYILGSALEEYNSKNTNEVKRILVSLNIYYYYTKSPSTGANLFNILVDAS